jgi:chaperonin GroEL
MEQGIVPGGGIALFNTIPSITGDKAVVSILSRALAAPLSAIIKNSGEEPFGIIEKLKDNWKKENIWLGFNALTNKIGDLKELGIIDPLKVVKTAFINAVSVASNYLTIGAAMTDIPEKKDKEMPGGGMDMGY